MNVDEGVGGVTNAQGRPIRVGGRRAWAGGIGQATVTVPQRLFDHNRIAAMGAVRAWRPNLNTPTYLIVTRREDVCALLNDPASFPTSYPPELIGSFLLATDDVAVHARIRNALANAMPDSSPQLRGQISGVAAGKVRAAVESSGRLDVGRELVHPCLAHVVRTYLGITGVSDADLLDWARAIFQAIFLNALHASSVYRKAVTAQRRFAEHVDGLLLQARKPGRVTADTVLARLIAVRRADDDAELRDNLIGLAIGWLWHGSRAAIVCVDELLRQPEALHEAQAAAVRNDLDQLRRLVWEVLRFRPAQVGLVRRCGTQTVIAPGTDRQTTVPAGQDVLVASHSAMWDGSVTPAPARFDATRADAQYLIFGAGMHRCLGERIMADQLPAMLAPLLRTGRIARAPGRAGKLRWVGPSPDGLTVVVGSQRGA